MADTTSDTGQQAAEQNAAISPVYARAEIAKSRHFDAYDSLTGEAKTNPIGVWNRLFTTHEKNNPPSSETFAARGTYHGALSYIYELRAQQKSAKTPGRVTKIDFKTAQKEANKKHPNARISLQWAYDLNTPGIGINADEYGDYVHAMALELSPGEEAKNAGSDSLYSGDWIDAYLGRQHTALRLADYPNVPDLLPSWLIRGDSESKNVSSKEVINEIARLGERKGTILAPVNLPGHWVLAELNRENRDITIYDSFASSENVKRAAAIVNKFIEAQTGAPWAVNSRASLSRALQVDATQCGPFTCFFAVRRMLGSELLADRSLEGSGTEMTAVMRDIFRAHVSNTVKNSPSIRALRTQLEKAPGSVAATGTVAPKPSAPPPPKEQREEINLVSPEPSAPPTPQYAAFTEYMKDVELEASIGKKVKEKSPPRSTYSAPKDLLAGVNKLLSAPPALPLGKPISEKEASASITDVRNHKVSIEDRTKDKDVVMAQRKLRFEHFYADLARNYGKDIANEAIAQEHPPGTPIEEGYAMTKKFASALYEKRAGNVIAPGTTQPSKKRPREVEGPKNAEAGKYPHDPTYQQVSSKLLHGVLESKIARPVIVARKQKEGWTFTQHFGNYSPDTSWMLFSKKRKIGEMFAVRV